MAVNVRQRRAARVGAEQRRRDEEDARDKRIYQQQQHIFQLHIDRLVQQAEAEQAREVEEHADEQRQEDERRQKQHAALDDKKRLWEKLATYTCLPYKTAPRANHEIIMPCCIC